MKEADIEAFMKQPWVMTCSDGSEGHPRKYGTFPRKIHEYVYEKHVLSLEAAVRSSTSLPAETLQIKDRGLLKRGYYADVLVFDPKRSWITLPMKLRLFWQRVCNICW